MIRKSTLIHAAALFLCAAMALTLFTGCFYGGVGSDTAETAAVEPVYLPTEAEIHKNDLKWSQAFYMLSTDNPDGYVTPDTVAFVNEIDGKRMVVNVPIDEIMEVSQSELSIPRTHYYDEMLGGMKDELLPVIDYAMLRGYSEFVIPARTYVSEHNWDKRWLISVIYSINGNGASTRALKRTELDDGTTLEYVRVMLPFRIDWEVSASKYFDALTEVRRIVGTVPDGYDEYQTALYLYKYLTDNVRYDRGDYYGEGGWELLYDALIEKNTVCAGYAEALYCLYNTAGIDCIEIIGLVKDEEDEFSSGYHAWCTAKLGDEYYMFDPTWDEGQGVFNYKYFAVSQEEMDSERPREKYGNYKVMPECPESLWEKRITSDEMEYNVFYAGLQVYCGLRASPIKTGDWFLRTALDMGEDEEFRAVGETDDGWVLTDIPYVKLKKEMLDYVSEQFFDLAADGCVRNDNGMLAYNPDPPDAVTYRLISVDAANRTAEVYVVGGDHTLKRSTVSFEITDNGRYYVLKGFTPEW